MSRMIIYLDLLLPTGSSDLPEAHGPCYASNLGLASDGVYMCPLCYHRGGSLLHCPSTLTTLSGGIFLLHWPWSHLHRTLSGILPYEARTFLTCQMAAAIICLTSIFNYYTSKQLPPTNSLQIELFGNLSLLTPKKYSKNLSNLLASKYSAPSGPML